MKKKHTTGNDLFKIGPRIRQLRRERELTLADIALRTGLSRGLLSKIENFRTLPSLPVLAQIARSLNIGLETIVKDIGTGKTPSCQLVPASQRTPLEREKSKGFHYAALLSRPFGKMGFESCVLTLEPGADRKPVSTDGDEFIFILRGKITFKVGSESFDLSSGDAFFFDGRLPHVPVNTTRSKAELLAIYLLRQHNQ